MRGVRIGITYNRIWRVLLTVWIVAVIVVIPTPTTGQTQQQQPQRQLSITVDRSCVTFSDTFESTFNVRGDTNARSWYWIGLYRASSIQRLTNDNQEQRALLTGEADLWVWACGDQNCEENPRQGSVTLGANGIGDWEARSWPPREGRFRTVLIHFVEDEQEPDQYVAEAYSNSFVIQASCDDNDNDGDNDTPPSTTVPPTSTRSGMAAVVRNARADIAGLIENTRSLSALYLRMIFHDCVGGACDGCINTQNMDNGGLNGAMNSLTDVEEKYRDQGLTRADLYVLASYVAVDMTMPDGDAINSPFIPFRHYGRNICDSTNPRRGPDPELCSPNLGTDEVVDFFQEHFDFTPRETAAIMGAHTVGIMRRNILGFAGENGWVPNNQRFDNQYYQELVGAGSNPVGHIEGAPQWRQATVNNTDLGLPDRFQWEGFPGGRKVVMLNSDVAMVRQLDDSNKHPTTGQVFCKFVEKDPTSVPRCPRARMDLFGPMVDYRQDNQSFLNDFRDAMIKMTDVGYQPRDCDAEGMCQLERI